MLKSSRGYGRVGVTRYNEPQWAEANFENLIKQGYKRAVWAYAAINIIATSTSSVPWIVEERQRNGKRVRLEEHDLEKLLLKPNKWVTGQELVESWTISMAGVGNAYWELVPGAGKAADRVVEIYPMRPDKVAPVPSAEDYIAGYVMKVENNKQIPFEPEEVMHTKFFDPMNDRVGLSPLQVAFFVVQTENAAVETQKLVFDNRAHVDGILSPKDPMNEREFDRFKLEWQESHQGNKNWFKPGFSNKPMNWTPLMLSSADLQLMELRSKIREDITAGIFGVPMMVFGIAEGTTFNNMAEARKYMWEQTIIPRYLDRLMDKINNDIALRWGDRIRVRFDLSNVPAMSKNFDSQVANAERLFRMGFTANEINERLELGFEPKPWRDHWWVSPFQVPAEDAGNDPDGDLPKGLPHIAGSKAATGAILKFETEEQKVAYWKAFDRRLRRWEKVWIALWDDLFADQLLQVEAALKEQTDKAGPGPTRLKVNPGDVFDREYWIQQVALSLLPRIDQVVSDSGESVTDDFDNSADRVTKWVQERANQLAYETSDTTHNAIKDALSEGQAAGEGYDQLRERVRSVLGPDASGVYTNRPEVIARTEVHAAYGAGRREAVKQTEEVTGKKMIKTWLSSRDDRVRDSHADMDGEEQPIDEEYSNGLMYPGDPDGEPSETVQCRCTEVYSEA